MPSEVALFCTDPLHLNGTFEDGRDLVLVTHDTAAIVEKLSWYRANPRPCARSRSGRSRAERV